MEHIRTTIADLMTRARACARRRFDNHDGFMDIPELGDFHEVVRQYKVDDLEFDSTYVLRLHQRADYTGIPLPLAVFTQKLFKQLRKRNFPMYVHTCWRSPELQRELFDKGLSTLTDGAHQRSSAVDIVHTHFHWEMKWEAWRYVGLIGEEIARKNSLPIRWGGRWTSFPDPAHWELKDWRKYPVVENHQERRTSTPYALERIGQ